MTSIPQHPLYFRRAPAAPTAPVEPILRLCEKCGGMFICAAAWRHVVCPSCVANYHGPLGCEFGSGVDAERDRIAGDAEFNDARRAGLRE